MAIDIGYKNESYKYLKQACRMDLDNYNKNVMHGIHAACCGSAFMMIVNGYAGLRIFNNMPHFKPYIDSKWNFYQFKFLFEGNRVNIKVKEKSTEYKLLEGDKFVFVHLSTTYKLDKKNNTIELDNI